MKKIVMPNDILLPEVARLIADGESVSIRTKGNSMLPFIRGDRDSVILESPEGFEVMDIVLAEVRKGAFVLHRVVGMEGDKVILMGDGNIRGREICRKEDVMAKAVAVVKDGRRLECRKRGHMIKAWLWRFMLPLRRYLLAIYRKTCKLFER